jgi:gas vesicle protein
MNKDEVLSLVAGLVCGGLVGAAVVILVTPQSGPDTRERIAGKFRDIVAAGKQAAADRRHELQQEYQARIRIPLPVAEPEKR